MYLVPGVMDEWFTWCRLTLAIEGFANIKSYEKLWRIEADYRKWPLNGNISITLELDVPGTRITAQATAKADDRWSILWKPERLILAVFRSGLEKHGHGGETAWRKCWAVHYLYAR